MSIPNLRLAASFHYRSVCIHTLILSLLIMLVLGGCATSKKPVFYPNPHYNTVGKAGADRDASECMGLASQAGNPNNQRGEIPKQAAAGAAIGAASAGAWGLVRGDAGERALAGAAAGGAAGTVRGAMRSSEPDPIYRRFVERCLGDRGYDIIGWR